MSSLLAVAAVACRALEPTYIEPALIMARGQTGTVTVPDTVARRADFDVSIETFGGGCTRTVARTEKKISGSTVELRPFNESMKPSGRVSCNTADFLTLTHTVTVQVKQAGPATILIIASQRDLVGRDTPAQIQRIVVVR